MTINEDLTRRMFYAWWRCTTEAKLLRPLPEELWFLERYPNNFKKVREAFHLAWITHKITEM